MRCSLENCGKCKRFERCWDATKLKPGQYIDLAALDTNKKTVEKAEEDKLPKG